MPQACRQPLKQELNESASSGAAAQLQLEGSRSAAFEFPLALRLTKRNTIRLASPAFMEPAPAPFVAQFDVKTVLGFAFVVGVIESSKTTPERIRSAGLTRLLTDLQFIVATSSRESLIEEIARLAAQDLGASSRAAVLIKTKGGQRSAENKLPPTTQKRWSAKATDSFSVLARSNK